MVLIEGLRGHVEEGNILISILGTHFGYLPGKHPKMCQARGCKRLAVVWVIGDDGIETNPGETTGQGGYLCDKHWIVLPFHIRIMATETDLSHNEEMCLYALRYLALSERATRGR